jgi:hypothetical protein
MFATYQDAEMIHGGAKKLMAKVVELARQTHGTTVDKGIDNRAHQLSTPEAR